MKIALIHEHLAQDGGAEMVFRAIAEMYPEAHIFTLLCKEDFARKYFPGRKIDTSIIQRLPGGVRHYQWYMPFMPMAVEFFDLSNYDLVISSASAFAKGVITGTDTLHISYCHSPTRYVWDYTHQYINELKYNKYLKKIISLVLNYVRIWDRAAADRVDVFVANSICVQKRISKYYRRESTVIYPFAETSNLNISNNVQNYFLIGGRMVPYKRMDIVVKAFKDNGRMLRVFGDGVDRRRLDKIAGGAPNIEFLGRVSDEEKYRLFAECQAFINPQEEDFGITPIEAMSAGRPVIAYGKGGVLETIKDGFSGILFSNQTPADITAAVERFEKTLFDSQSIRASVQQFSKEKFKADFDAFVEKEFDNFKSSK